jgi:hypothetical protein
VSKLSFKLFISRLDSGVDEIEASSLIWSATSHTIIKLLAPNKAFRLTITGIGCHNFKQSTTPIDVRTETFSNGVIALSDTNKINSKSGIFLQYTNMF